MNYENIYNQLGFTDLLRVSEETMNIEVEEFYLLGVDKVYFSGDYPAIFFKEVKNFDHATLTAIAKIQHLAWNYRRVMFLFVSSLTEVRIYDCNSKPFNYQNPDIQIENSLKDYELVKEDIKSLSLIKEIFSRISVDSGTLWNTENVLREKITVQSRVDKFLVKSLLSAAKILKRDGLSEDMIHSLLMRSIFILYLEDKGASKDTTLYSDINDVANSYFDILADVSDTYSLFEKVQEHFNGNVFPLIEGEEKVVTSRHLAVIKASLFDGNTSGTLGLFEWRLFRFDIIQIELLSEIYETFLEEFRAESKQESGQYYTPPALVQLILNEKLKINSGEKNWNIRLLDPACGSGIFLVESFKRLVKRWKSSNPTQTITFDDLKQILENNIYGIEYDRLAIRVATFSLYLAIVEQLNPVTLWIDKSQKFPYLINDAFDLSLKVQGKNLFRADTIKDVSPLDLPEMDLVIGNPPFGSKTNSHKPTHDFCKKHSYGQDLVIPFLCKAVDFSPNGSVALIFNTKILTNTEKPFENFRSWLFNDNYVEKVYNLSIFRNSNKTFGGQLFTSAVGPVSIVFYQKNIPALVENVIEYWAPKTYVKNSLVEGVVIDSTDIKFLPRSECQDPKSKIWKVAMWGTLEDYNLVQRLNNNYGKFRSELTRHKIHNGVGFQLLTSDIDKPKIDNELSDQEFLDADNIEPYFTSPSWLQKINRSIKSKKAISFYLKYYDQKTIGELPKINAFRRLGDKAAYSSPHFLIKKGLKEGSTCASYLDYDCAFRDGVYGFYGTSKDVDFLKVAVAFLNSTIANYYLFLSISSFGIERDQIMKGEYLDTPFTSISDQHKSEIVAKIDELIKVKKNNLLFETVNVKAEIDNIFFQSFNISQIERCLIDDTVNFSIDLFFKGHNSIALKPTVQNENFNYAQLLKDELQGFIGDADSIQTTFFDVNRSQPLNMVKVVFDSEFPIVKMDSVSDLDVQLSEINKSLFERKSDNIYIKKQIKFFSGNIIYIIKPNQKRFWSKSSAINDSRDLLAEILIMK